MTKTFCDWCGEESNYLQSTLDDDNKQADLCPTCLKTRNAAIDLAIQRTKRLRKGEEPKTNHTICGRPVPEWAHDLAQYIEDHTSYKDTLFRDVILTILSHMPS